MRLDQESVIIADNGTLSGEINLRERILRAIVVPAGWVAADIAFESAVESGGTFLPVDDWDGVRWVTAATASRISIVRPELGHALQFVKIASVDVTVPATPVSQTGGPLTVILLTEGRIS